MAKLDEIVARSDATPVNLLVREHNPGLRRLAIQRGAADVLDGPALTARFS